MLPALLAKDHKTELRQFDRASRKARVELITEGYDTELIDMVIEHERGKLEEACNRRGGDR
jgi:hypothetical protein